MTKLKKSNKYIDCSNSLYKQYFKDVAKISLLSKDEERQLLIKAQSGDINARNKIVEANQKFIIKICRQYINRGIPMEDLIGEANLGLIRAIEKFDVTSEFKFLTYAVWWVKQAIKISFSQKSRLIRLPAHKSDQVYKIEKAYDVLYHKYGKEPTAEDIAKHLQLKTGDVELLLTRVKTPMSFDAEIVNDKSDSLSLSDVIADTNGETAETVTEKNNLKSLVNRIMDNSLDTKEKIVLTKRFGLDNNGEQSLHDVGKALGVTKERVRQIEKSALQKFRRKANVELLKDFA